MIKDTFGIEKIKKELDDFFEIDSPDIEVIVVPSRKEYDKIRGHKTESWQVGTARDGKAYVLHPDVWQKEGVHDPKGFPTTIKHESVHLYYYKLSSNNDAPFWLNEGIAYFLCHQEWKIGKNDHGLTPDDTFRNNSNYPPRVGYSMVEALLQEFGKEKLLELIKRSIPGNTLDDFNKIFEEIFGINPNDYYKKLKTVG